MTGAEWRGRWVEETEEEKTAAELSRGKELICTSLLAGQRSLPATCIQEKLVCVCVCVRVELIKAVC